MKAYLTGIFFLLGFSVFETAVLSNIMILPAVPDLVLLCSLYLAMQNGRSFGVTTGFFSGLFLDFLSPCPFGFNCLLRTITGYIAGLFNKTINISGIFFPVFLGITGTLLKTFVLWIISLFYPNVNVTSSVLSLYFIAELILNGIFAPLVFRFLDLFKKVIVLNPEKVS